jgi:protein SERAC1
MHSAILAEYTHIGIRDNHIGMTKFESTDDPGFMRVTGELQRWVKRLKAEPGK